MNRYLFIDAISCLDLKFIEEYIIMKRKIKTNKIIKKKLNNLKKTLIASCLALFFFFSFFLLKRFSYINSEEVVLTATISYLAISLIASLACVAIVGITAWTIGKRVIKKKCEQESIL